MLFVDAQTFTQEHARLYADSLAGYTAAFSAEIRRKLFPGERVRVTFDTTTIQRGAFNEAMQGYQLAIQLGVMTPNEVRLEMGLPPIDGGDNMYVGPNMTGVPGGTNDTEDLLQDGSSGAADDYLA
jgi:phage portal protein BeeE